MTMGFCRECGEAVVDRVAVCVHCARHVSPQPSPDRAALVELLAEAILDRADYLPEGDWVDVSRLVCPDDDPDCDLEEVAEDWNVELVCWEYANDDFRDQARRRARAALAASTAASGWPRPEPIMPEEIDEIARWSALPLNLTDDARNLVVREILAALPDRHRRLVLGVQGE